MTLTILAVLIFLIVMGLTISGIYFLIEAPANRRRIRARMAAIQQVPVEVTGESEGPLLRHEVLSNLPTFNLILMRIPFAVRMQMYLQQAAVEMTVATLFLISAGLGLVGFMGGLVMGFPPLLAVVPAVALGGIPFAIVSFKRSRRFARFEEIFPEAMDLLARAVRAGHAFTSGLELIATEMPEPVAGEFRIAYDQQNLGLPLRDALSNLVIRVPLPDVRIFITTLQIQRESGGNLAEILDNLSEVIRERFKILRQVKTYTAQGRMSLYVLTAMPPITGILLYFTSADYMEVLLTDSLGHLMIGVAVVLQLFGYLVIRKIIQIKV